MPLIVRFPGDAHAGEVVAGNVRLVDVAPTIAEWVDVPGGAEWAGESLLELIGAPRADRPVLAALSNAELGTVALIDGEWKWIEAQGARPDLLFNRLQDPDEQIDVRKQQVDLGIRLQKQLADWLADQKARSASVRAVPMDAEGKNLQEMEKELLNQMGYLGDLEPVPKCYICWRMLAGFFNVWNGRSMMSTAPKFAPRMWAPSLRAPGGARS